MNSEESRTLDVVRIIRELACFVGSCMQFFFFFLPDGERGMKKIGMVITGVR